ncbi:hypothetical protein RND81_03G163700 [Saponaria officinalis]|uniref:Bacterial surface antigen (D15) domain-containing protein n=1 Tax=Saponaria officinalis TaxID=3572 RepID=A0AAW1MB97_SAPOF
MNAEKKDVRDNPPADYDDVNGEDSDEDDFLEESEEDEEEEDYDGDSPPSSPPSTENIRSMLNKLTNKVSTERIPLRVHDIIIKGNSKTKDFVIEAEILDDLKNATSLQEIFQAAAIANLKLKQLGIFDEVNLTLDGGPRELPGTTNIVVEVVESKSPLSGELGFFTKPGARSWSLEGSLKLKNLFGYADLWDGSVSYGWDQTSEVSAGVALPRIRRWASPVFARASLLSQDWQTFSSYKERALGVGFGLLSTQNHSLMYNLTWRTLTDPSQMSGTSVRRQLGHSLISSLKYTFKVDKRNSQLRPTRGYAFSFSTLLAGLNPDNRSARFVRQELDLRYALPLGFYRTALNLGIAAGVIFPWGKGFLDRPSSLPDRFFMGGNSSPVCSLAGPISLLGFKSRGLGPTEPRRQSKEKPDGDSSASSERDALGGDLAVSAFADLSFDLPLRVFRDAGIHGHVFAATGNLTKLTENEWRRFSAKGFFESFRSTVGCGIIVPTKLFRMEVNYCHIVKQFEHDHGKTGVQFSFSTPF